MKAIIMAGGSGTRLWPLSRSRYPKQFLKLKKIEHSLFQMTIERCLSFCSLSDIYVLTVSAYAFIIQAQIEELGYDRHAVHVLLEPQAKNTLPAIYNGVRAIRAEGGDDTVVVLASDHLIRDTADFLRQLKAGAPLSESYIFAFGICPSGPETGYGYIMPGERLPAGYRIEQFKEKPGAATAKEYVAKGYLWNSGMFMFGTALFTREVERLAPKVYAAFEQPTIEACFEQTPSISVDYGIMETSEHTAVLPLSIDWDDLGSFSSFYAAYAGDADERGNVALGGEIMVEASGNLVYVEGGKACAVVGVDDLVIVDQDDALLICRRDSTQQVKTAVAELNARRDSRADVHRTEYHPWGALTQLEEGPFYRVLRMSVLTGKSQPEQAHPQRDEHWVVIGGTATVTINGAESTLHTGESVLVPAGARHSLRNGGPMILELLEVQSGRRLGGDGTGNSGGNAGFG